MPPEVQYLSVLDGGELPKPKLPKPKPPTSKPDRVEIESYRRDRPLDEWGELIRADLASAVEGLIAAGRHLIEAKAQLQLAESCGCVLPDLVAKLNELGRLA